MMKQILEKLLILDLDETLIYSTSAKLKVKEDFKFENYYVYLRPHLNWFLQEISKHYKIGIWSSADEFYVSELVKRILPKDFKIELLWDQRWCSYEFDKVSNTWVYAKDLNQLKKLNYLPEQIILVDDSLYNAAKNEGNVMLVKPFKGEMDDQEFKKLYNALIMQKE